MSDPDFRMERARKILLQEKVFPGHAPGQYLVCSQSKPVIYRVSLYPPSCTCPDFTYRRKVCKHVLAARLYAANRKGGKT